MIAVNDLYPTIQGEGCMTGTPVILLRLHGCAVGCPWCDTKETWNASGPPPASSIAEACATPAAWALAPVVDVVEAVRHVRSGEEWVLLTGGEPGEQDIAALVAALQDAGLSVAVETSGTAPGVVDAAADWVCVSPKLGMPGGQHILPPVMAMADEVKMVVGKPSDIMALEALLASCPTSKTRTVCLQPLSQSAPATELCLRMVARRGWRLSVQTHKYLNLP